MRGFLIQNTKASVGRGTEFPFEACGSPYYEGVEGFEITFNPRSMSGALEPPFMDEACYGEDLRQVPIGEYPGGRAQSRRPDPCIPCLATCFVSYVGRWKYPQLGRHIREFWTETPVGPFPLIEVAAVNGKIFVSFLQPFSDRRYYDALLDELKENGIEYVEYGSKPVCVADIRACE